MARPPYPPGRRRVADDADRAGGADQSAVSLSGAVAHIRDVLSGEGADCCVDCDAPIPPARRAAYRAATRCVDCQAEHEGRR
jgi:phage/conjugal plasmid C-4 type zinc finger TraR family protein